jgi:hypothetical protein
MDANEIVEDRQASYGHPKENFTRIALMWNTYLKAKYRRQYEAALIGAEDIPQMMILLKQARLMNGYHADSVTDQEGYAKTHHMLHDPEPKQIEWNDPQQQEGAN